MAGHELISAQLDLLAARLPPQAVEELADGLQEVYEHHLRRRPDDPAAAARLAIAEFGDAETVTAAFVRSSPWRRMALVLLATGPVMAVVWAVALVSAKAWEWPFPLPVKILYGLALLTVVALLAIAALAKRAYRRTRGVVTGAALVLIVLDLSMVGGVLAVAPGVVWPLAVAVPASVLRVLAVVRALPAAGRASC